ncbi:MAG: hypothetical protein KAH77_08070 [Thiomargarita sp.]|nr:hypothetical protein [Thiomargarita sp.]
MSYQNKIFIIKNQFLKKYLDVISHWIVVAYDAYQNKISNIPEKLEWTHHDDLHALPLGIVLKDYTHGITASDMLVYHYCQERTQAKTGTERFLVYDFKADRLDLSLIRIDWNQTGTSPKTWMIENRIGVPIAENHLDRLLVRMVDHYLTDPTVVDPQIFDYIYQAVEQENDTLRDTINVELATSRLLQNIRHSKHHWDGHTFFELKIEEPGIMGVLNYLGGQITHNNGQTPYIKHIKHNGIGYSLCIPSNLIHDYPIFQEFITFVTETIVEELLQGAGIMTAHVDTVLISGRGALWPGLRERVWRKFPNHCHKPKLRADQDSKNTLIKEMMTWQDFSQNQGNPHINTSRFAILCDNTKDLIFENDWSNSCGIDLGDNSTFCIVYVAHHNPNPKLDLNTLRSYFYIRLKQYCRHLKWDKNPYLFVTRHGNVIRVANAQNEGFDFTEPPINSQLIANNVRNIGDNGVLSKRESYY